MKQKTGTDRYIGHIATSFSSAMEKVAETQFRLREKTLLTVLSKLQQRILKQRAAERAPVSPEQVQTVSFLIIANRNEMRQQGFEPLDTAQLRIIEERYLPDAVIDASIAIVSLLLTIQQPTLRLTSVEIVVMCYELAMLLENAGRLHSEREAKTATRH